MSARGDAARRRIMDCAKQLFSQKGYGSVSMQDICAATGLSRGGLYRHYASTAAIFAAIINDEQLSALASLERAVQDRVPPSKMLYTFVASRMRRMVEGDISFENAVSEFAASSEEGAALIRRRAETSVRILGEMLHLGSESGDFSCDDAENTAKNILWMLEGMAKHAALMPIDQSCADAQMKLIEKMIGK